MVKFLKTRASSKSLADRNTDPVIMHMVPNLHLGGVNRALINSLSFLADTSCSQIVVSLGPNMTLASEIERLGVQAMSVGHSRRVDTSRTLARCLRVAKKHNVSLIHSHLPLAIFYGGLTGRMRRIPTVASLHYVREDKATLKDYLVRLVTDRFVSVSYAVRDSFINAGAIRSSDVIYNGMPDITFTKSWAADDRLRSELEISGEQLFLLNVGRLVPPKNQLFLLSVMDKLISLGVDAVLVIAGGGELKEVLEDEIRNRDLKSRVRLTGPRSDILELMATADLMLAPSTSEGFGVALIEAMAIGCPIIASEIAAFIEVTTGIENATLVETSCLDSWVSAIGDFVRDDKKPSLGGTAASTSIAERFACSATANQLAALYESLICA